MPLSRGVAQFNRRVTNPIARLVATWAPGFAVVVHVGRRSGATYETPINAFRIAGGYRVALTYGAQADWVRNVLAAGSCTLRLGGRRVECRAPRLGRDPSNGWAPLPVRTILGLIGVSEYLDLSAGRRGEARGG